MTPESFTIRAARASDAQVILQVHQEAILAKAASHYGQPTLNTWALAATPDRIARLEQHITNPEFIVLVAETGDEVIGYGMAVPSDGQLRALYVKPNSVGHVGSTLLVELEKLAFRVAGSLTCDASLNAVAFYAAHGYAQQGKVDHVLRSGASIPCMRMTKVRPAAFATPADCKA